MASAAMSPASTRCRTAPAISTTTPRRSTARRRTTPTRLVSTTASLATTRSSPGSTTASSASMHRGPGRVLPANAGRGRRAFDLGPFVAGIQNTRLTTHGAAFNYSKVVTPRIVNEFRAGYARTFPSTFQSDFGIDAAASLGINGINVSEITSGLPNINVPDMTGISGGPAFYRQPQAVPLAARGHGGVAEGRSQPEVRLSARRSLCFSVHPYRHARQHQLRPQLHQQPGQQRRRLGTRVAIDRLYQQRRARLPARALHAAHAGTRPLHPGRFQGRLALHHQCRAALRIRAETEEDNKIVIFDLANLRLIYADEDGASASVNKQTRYGNFAPRLGLTYDLFGDYRRRFCAPGLRSPTSPSSPRRPT